MVRSKIAFLQSPDENLLAFLQVTGGIPGAAARSVTVTEYVDENVLLEAIVLAKLDDDTTIKLASNILLAVVGGVQDKVWTNLSAEAQAYAFMGLQMPDGEEQPKLFSQQSPGVALAGVDLHHALEQTPVPLSLVEGPEHKYVFANDAYVRAAGRTSASQLVGKKIREAFSEVEGQAFFGLLDQTYRSGETFVGHEMLVKLHSQPANQLRDHYFDFVYHPVRNAAGEVCGIFSQAADVTERVLDKQVREAREQQLYQQWAELDTLYRTAPLSMMLLRASDMTIQRLNDREAAHLGGRAQELIGRRIEDFYPDHPHVGEVLQRVVRDRRGCTLQVFAAAPSARDKVRKWTWNLNPILDTLGRVESIASAVFEIADQPSDPEGFLEE